MKMLVPNIQLRKLLSDQNDPSVLRPLVLDPFFVEGRIPVMGEPDHSENVTHSLIAALSCEDN